MIQKKEVQQTNPKSWIKCKCEEEFKTELNQTSISNGSNVINYDPLGTSYRSSIRSMAQGPPLVHYYLLLIK